jgi:outer membrane receptor protein involved in Fe transport
MLTAAAFDLTLDDAIIFTSVKDNGQIVETYRNVSRTGSRGMEADLRLQLPRWRAALGYAYYNSSGKNRVDSYAVPGRDDLLLGFPAHKISLSGALRLNDRLSLAPTLLFTSASFGVSHDPLTDQARAERLGPRLVVNLYLNCHDLLTPGLDLGLGVYNLLNADVPYLQPYDGGHAPLPGPSREFLARLTYAWGW